MSKHFFRRVMGGLYPDGEKAEAVLRKIPQQTLVAVEIKLPRNVDLLRKFWALMDTIADNTLRFDTSEQLVEWLKIETGHCRKFPIQGTDMVYVIPNSIAVDQMPEEVFQDFYDRAMDIVFRDILPGAREEVIREVTDRLDPAFRGERNGW